MNLHTRLLFRAHRHAVALLLILAASAAAQERVVAIGDVHGSYPQFVHILQQTGLINSRYEWSGGSTILVQMGDVTNRGPQSRPCLDLLMQLEAQAPDQKGKVIPLLGNHEVMVILGDLRYVLPEDYQAFAGDQSAALRERAYQNYRAFLTRSGMRGRVQAAPDEAAPERWMAEHPLGFFELRDAFGPQGTYGRWLRQLDTVVQIGDVLFVHGGLSPSLRFRSLREINDRIREEMTRFDSLWQSLTEQGIIWRYMTLEEARRAVQGELEAVGSPGQVEDARTIEQMRELLKVDRWMMASPSGPLWYRGYAREREEKLAPGLEKMMSRLKVRRIVVAHTITDSRRITPRFDNRIFLIDTGMLLDGRGGRASALEIENGQFIAHYSTGEQQVLLRPEGGGTAPAPRHGQAQGKQ
jgi:hypothetical protein